MLVLMHQSVARGLIRGDAGSDTLVMKLFHHWLMMHIYFSCH